MPLLRNRLRSLFWRGYQACSPEAPPPERCPPMPDYERLREFLKSLDLPDEAARGYLEIHLDRIATTLSLVPPPQGPGRALELGTYMHMAPAIHSVLGYEDVRGAYFGPLGTSDRKQVTVKGKVVFEGSVDLFNAEKDRYPYDAGSFGVVLACEIFEHLLHDPMHLLFECCRILSRDGVLILTTPNVVSATAVARVLTMAENPQLYSKYADPRGPYADTEFGHMREYTPGELREALRCAGFQVDWLFTTNAPGYGAQTWVLSLLRDLKLPTTLRGEQIYCVARKSPELPKTRYPTFLYEV